MSAPFQFKQFKITQDHTPMKVGTDGVLLGAWTDISGAKEIIDIGAGTGLIALMLAQRAPHAHITAIEHNREAFLEALENVNVSPFAKQIDLLHCDLADFEPRHSFDLIISNPPFFRGSLLPENKGRSLARHDIGFSPEEFANTSKWLSNSGIISGIYPTDIYKDFHKSIETDNLSLVRKCTVWPTPSKPPHRILFTYSKGISKMIQKREEELVIETGGRHQYSSEYINLTREFYL